jgi:hypothetical protein
MTQFDNKPNFKNLEVFNMASKIRFTLPDGQVISAEHYVKQQAGTESSGNQETEAEDAMSTESWMREPVYDVESVSIDPKTMDCNVQYSVEKFLGNKKDPGAPPAGKMRIQLLGYGTGVVFSDGSKAKNDVNAIFTSPYIKNKIKEFNDYYINQKGYQPFTQEDARTLRTDVAQILRKIFSLNIVNKVEIKFFDRTAIYGLFSHFLGKALDKASDANGGAEGGVKSLLFPTQMNGRIPYCIVYTHMNEKGEKRVIVKRFLVSGIFSKNITKGAAQRRSGGKEIGTVE